ncbi:MAG: carboxypeptidase-like regulatory domain-containing protein [Pyrinomonadaceae bacterium]
MRKLFLMTLIIAVTFSFAPAQQTTSSQNSGDIPNMGKAPTEPNGIGRLDARVLDEDGNPVRGASLKLESERTDGFFCESWNSSDERGISVLPPLHMGSLKLIVKAKGYETQKISVPASSLGEPVRVTLVRKK